MADLTNIFEEIYTNVHSRRSDLISSKDFNKVAKFNDKQHRLSGSSQAVSEQSSSLPKGPQDEFILQKQIRPLFGKEGVNSKPIGTHPDFLELELNNYVTENHYITTLFVDIKGSTRLSLLYPLEKVYIFKNSVIQTCVEIIRSFDGHVHRIMGDAVMAFFGSKDAEKEDSIADAINCCLTTRIILEESIKPWMERNGIDAKDFGFRIGCDFGDDQEVLWGSYGYQNVGEVSATGLPVDMASKLQNLANKNQTMLGQGILEFINWPEKYSKIKEKVKGNEKTTLPCVTPNLTDAVGNPINYKMRVLNYENCLNYIALPRTFREKINGSKVINNPYIDYKCHYEEDNIKGEYISASKFLNKDVSLLFILTAHTKGNLQFPLKVHFVKTNHGQETPESERDIEYAPVIITLNTKRRSKYDRSIIPFSIAKNSEYTLYRGLHTMRCDVYDRNKAIVFRDWIGVMIK